MSTFKRFLAASFFGLIFLNINAQVKTKTFGEGIPKHFLPVKDLIGRNIIIEPPAQFYELKQEADRNEIAKSKNQLAKFALPSLVNIDVLKEAILTESNGISTFALTIKAPSALNLSVHFNQFILSENSVLSIYNDSELTDSITAKENNENKLWVTRVYEGNTLNIVLKLPSKEIGQSFIKIGSVFLGYKQFGGRFGSPGASASCNINVACPLGVGWEAERNSVAIINGVNGYASGVLLMNTCGTNIPYVLTAKHVLDQAGPTANWVFQFFYYSTDCNTNTGYREDVQFNGCQLKANNATSDFALLLLNQTPSANSGIHYAGWNRTLGFFNAPPSFTGIHHPNADVMKISRSTTVLTRSSDGHYNDNAHWRVIWSQGITANGSSGSPLFDQNHRIIGQLHDGLSFCSTPNAPDWYGSFDVSWDGGGTNATRLSNWLDPGNSGAVATNTTNVSGLLAFLDVNTLNIIGPTLICNSSDYYISNLPAGASVAWSIPGSAGSVLQLSQNTPVTNQLRITNQKWYGVTTTLTATITNLGCGIPDQTRTMTIANDNSSSPYTSHEYYQEACTFYNVSHPSQSGTIISNSSPAFVHQGCTVYVNLGDMTGRTVSLASGSGQPVFWYVGSTSYYQNTLYFQLPYGSGGIPFTFKITGNGACYEQSLLFFSYSNNGRYSASSNYSFNIAPNPVKNILLITAKKENQTILPKTKLLSKDLQYTLNIYETNTNRILLTQKDIVSKVHSINVSILRTGIYVLQIMEGGHIHTMKFLKE